MIKVDYLSPIGVIEISGTNQAIHSILYTDQKSPERLLNAKHPDIIKNCCEQLDEYFHGKRT